MRSTTLAMVLGITAGVFAAPAMADSTLVKFDGGIGAIPVSSGVAVAGATTSTTVNRNFVRGVPPPGQIWVIRELRAEVTVDGRVRANGRGLLLGGGNAGASVFATLICEAAPPFVERSTTLAGVALDPDGDFMIDDMLDQPASECASPVLLIRNAANKAWFAAGIPRR